MEFGVEKCDTLIMKSGKRQMTKRITLPNQEKSVRLEKWKQVNTIKHAEMKEKIPKKKKKKVGRGFTSIQDSVDASIQ